VLADFLNLVQGISCRVEPSIADMPLLKPVAPATRANVPAAKPFAPAARPIAARTIEDWYALVKEINQFKGPKTKEEKDAAEPINQHL